MSENPRGNMIVLTLNIVIHRAPTNTDLREAEGTNGMLTQAIKPHEMMSTKNHRLVKHGSKLGKYKSCAFVYFFGKPISDLSGCNILTRLETNVKNRPTNASAPMGSGQ